AGGVGVGVAHSGQGLAHGAVVGGGGLAVDGVAQDGGHAGGDDGPALVIGAAALEGAALQLNGLAVVVDEVDLLVIPLVGVVLDELVRIDIPDANNVVAIHPQFLNGILLQVA